MKNDEIRDCHEAFGKYIKDIRLRKGLNQSELASKLGMSQSYYSRIESGKRDVDLAVAIKICDTIGVDIRDFANKYL